MLSAPMLRQESSPFLPQDEDAGTQRFLYLQKNQPYRGDSEPSFKNIRQIQQSFSEVLKSEAVQTDAAIQSEKGLPPKPYEVKSKQYYYSLIRESGPGFSLDSITRHPLTESGFDEETVESFDIIRRGYDRTGVTLEIKYRGYDPDKPKDQRESRAYNDRLSVQKWAEALYDLRDASSWTPPEEARSPLGGNIIFLADEKQKRAAAPNVDLIVFPPHGKMQ